MEKLNEDLLRQVKEHSDDAQIGWGNLYYHVLPNVLKKHNCKVGAEIGTAFGGHAESILLNTDVEKLYCIDSYKHYSDSTDSFCLLNGKKYEQIEYDVLYELTKERLSKFGDRQSLVRENSKSGSELVNEELDFVFIDAQHTKEAVLEDIKIWASKVKVGGIISGHDYGHPNFPGVLEAVWQSFPGQPINSEEGYVWWIIKE